MQKLKIFLKYTFWISVAVFYGLEISFFAVGFLQNSYSYLGDYIEKSEELFAVQVENSLALTNYPIENLRKTSVTITFVGDIMLDRGVRKSVTENADNDFSFIFKDMGFLADSSILFGNLEGPASDKGKDMYNLYSFRMNLASLDELRRLGFNVLSVANNHAGDWGMKAFEDTLSQLKKRDIIAVGGGLNKKEASTVKIIESEGIKIGFLAFSDIGPAWLEAADNKPGILLASEQNFLEIIKRASESADILAVSFHFGDEYQKVSNSRQQELARGAIDSGAKIVIGHHPHIVQEIEKYKEGVIAYSLGNFIFDQAFSDKTMEGLVLQITVSKDRILEIEKIEIKLNRFFQPKIKDNNLLDITFD